MKFAELPASLLEIFDRPERPAAPARLTMTHQAVIDGTVEIFATSDGLACGGSFLIPLGVFAASIAEQDADILLPDLKVRLEVTLQPCRAGLTPPNHYHFICKSAASSE
ncbi:hypothetical protein [Prosthecobacter sp.]|uniref:hypothetical protein n=1 Tax=Prosthecobacter sp. TaxID=1965333 RepID=UPI0037840524